MLAQLLEMLEGPDDDEPLLDLTGRRVNVR